MTTSYDAVVLAGGAARRLGGADKPALALGGLMLLDRVLGACAGASATVVVGPRRRTARPVLWTREQPPGGGPLPALAAGLAALGAAADLTLLGRTADPAAGPDAPGPVPVPASSTPSGAESGTGSDGSASGQGTAPGEPSARPGVSVAPARGTPTRASGVVVVLAADMPFLTAETVRALVRALDQAAEGTGGTAAAEGVVLTDPGGRDQPLAAAYRTEPLCRELALLRAEHGSLSGLPLRMLTAELALARVPDPIGEASFDCDTWDDVARARARLDAQSPG